MKKATKKLKHTSYTPSLSVVALALSALLGAASSAMAVNECGPAAGSTITCDAVT